MKSIIKNHKKENISNPKLYYGEFTQKAVNNFNITNRRVHLEFFYALTKVKIAAAYGNYISKILDKKKYEAIVRASEELLTGAFDESLVVETIQAGGFTPTNMNVNEVIAKRANELMGSKDKNYEFVHPNNHVNMSQSTNDTVPTATFIVAVEKIDELNLVLNNLFLQFEKLSKKYSSVLKVGRTHLQDAVPIRFGQIFDSYANVIKENNYVLKNFKKEFYKVPLGGTAVGNYANVPDKYVQSAVKKLSSLTKIPFKADNNPAMHTQTMGEIIELSGILNALASDIIRIASDLRMYNSGPRGGIGELSMPEIEPGSSIMPGKVNPSYCEALIMTGFVVQGNNQVITSASQFSNFELNVYNPIIISSIIDSLNYLINSINIFANEVVPNIVVNEKRCRELLEKSLCYATSLSPYLGYDVVSLIVHRAVKNDSNLRDEVVNAKILTNAEFDLIVIPMKSKFQKINTKLIKEIKFRDSYKKFCQDNSIKIQK